MLKKLRSQSGDGSVFPTVVIICVSFIAMMVIFVFEIDHQIINLQKARYTKAVDMAVATSAAKIELSDDVNAATEDEQRIGKKEELSNLDIIAWGYGFEKKLRVNKKKLINIFYEVLLRNFQVQGVDRIEAFKKYVPLKAILEYDTMSLSSYDDVWQEYRLFFIKYDPAAAENTNIYMTLSDKCYTLIDKNLPMEQRFTEENRLYFSVTDPNDLNNTLQVTEAEKNRELGKAVRRILEGFANVYKSNHYGYQLEIGYFDEHKFLSAAKDVTFFCLVEGIPIKSFLSSEPDRSFYAFSFGGASLKRADQ